MGSSCSRSKRRFEFLNTQSLLRVKALPSIGGSLQNSHRRIPANFDYKRNLLFHLKMQHITISGASLRDAHYCVVFAWDELIAKANARAIGGHLSITDDWSFDWSIPRSEDLRERFLMVGLYRVSLCNLRLVGYTLISIYNIVNGSVNANFQLFMMDAVFLQFTCVSTQISLVKLIFAEFLIKPNNAMLTEQEDLENNEEVIVGREAATDLEGEFSLSVRTSEENELITTPWSELSSVLHWVSLPDLVQQLHSDKLVISESKYVALENSTWLRAKAKKQTEDCIGNIFERQQSLPLLSSLTSSSSACDSDDAEQQERIRVAYEAWLGDLEESGSTDETVLNDFSCAFLTPAEELYEQVLYFTLYRRARSSDQVITFAEASVPFIRLLEIEGRSYPYPQFLDIEFRQPMFDEGVSRALLSAVLIFCDPPLIRQVSSGVNSEFGFRWRLTRASRVPALKSVQSRNLDEWISAFVQLEEIVTAAGWNSDNFASFPARVNAVELGHAVKRFNALLRQAHYDKRVDACVAPDVLVAYQSLILRVCEILHTTYRSIPWSLKTDYLELFAQLFTSRYWYLKHAMPIVPKYLPFRVAEWNGVFEQARINLKRMKHYDRQTSERAVSSLWHPDDSAVTGENEGGDAQKSECSSRISQSRHLDGRSLPMEVDSLINEDLDVDRRLRLLLSYKKTFSNLPRRFSDLRTVGLGRLDDSATLVVNSVRDSDFTLNENAQSSVENSSSYSASAETNTKLNEAATMARKKQNGRLSELQSSHPPSFGYDSETPAHRGDINDLQAGNRARGISDFNDLQSPQNAFSHVAAAPLQPTKNSHIDINILRHLQKSGHVNPTLFSADGAEHGMMSELNQVVSLESALNNIECLKEILLLERRLELARDWTLCMSEVLHLVITEMQSATLVHKQRVHLAVLCGVICLMSKTFRDKCIDAVLTEEERARFVPCWRGVGFVLDARSLRENRDWSAVKTSGIADIRAQLDWTPFDTLVTMCYGEAFGEKNLVCRAIQNDTFTFLQSRSTFFYLFLMNWIRYICNALNLPNGDGSSLVRWEVIPGYLIFVKAFLIQIKERPLGKFSDALLTCATALLSNKKFLSLLIRIVLFRANFYNRNDVAVVYNYIQYWMNAYFSAYKNFAQFQDLHILKKSIELVLESDLVMQMACVLGFLYNQLDKLITNITFSSSIIDYLCYEKFFDLILHWNYMVRCHFISILLFHVAEMARCCLLDFNRPNSQRVFTKQMFLSCWAYLMLVRNLAHVGIEAPFPARFAEFSVKKTLVLATKYSDSNLTGIIWNVPSSLPLIEHGQDSNFSFTLDKRLKRRVKSKDRPNTQNEYFAKNNYQHPPDNHTLDLNAYEDPMKFLPPLKHFSDRKKVYKTAAKNEFKQIFQSYKLWMLSGKKVIPPVEVQMTVLDAKVEMV